MMGFKRFFTAGCGLLLLLPLFSLLVSLLVASCSGSFRHKLLALPSTPLVTESKRWGVVNSNFIRLRLRPNEQAEVINGLSKGIMLEVIFALKEPGAAPEDAPRWYQVKAGEVKGWVRAANIKTCESKQEAEELAQNLR